LPANSVKQDLAVIGSPRSESRVEVVPIWTLDAVRRRMRSENKLVASLFADNRE